MLAGLAVGHVLVVYDADNKAARAYGVDSLPTLVLVSTEGTVLARTHGLTGDAEIDRLMKKALEPDAPG